MRIWLMVGLFFSASYCHSLEITAENIEEYWKEVTLTVHEAANEAFDQPVPVFVEPDQQEEVAKSLRNLKCFEKEVQFLACANAIRLMGQLLNPPQILIPTKRLSEPQWHAAKVLEVYSKMSLVEIPPIPRIIQDESPRQRSVRLHKENKEMLQISREELSLTSGDRALPIDFHAIVDRLLEQKPADLMEAKMAHALALGYLTATDAHAHLEMKKFVEAVTGDGDGSFGGIGLPVGRKDNVNLATSSPLPDSPAERAGLKVGDVLLEIDQKPVSELPPTIVVRDMLRGKVGSPVHLKVRRAEKEMEFEITRQLITLKNVDGRVVKDISGNPFGHIVMKNFLEKDACSKVESKIRELESKVEGYILDLRDNTGGDKDQAVCVASLFVGKEPILYLLRPLGNGMNDVQAEKGSRDAITNKKLIVMINGKSESAGEAVPGALQGLRRAFLLGTRSFGKASAQSPRDYEPDDHFLVYRTFARFYVPFLEEGTPNESPQRRTSQQTGVQPDFEVPFKPNATEDELFELREGDIYMNALNPDGILWKMIRSDEVSVIKAECLNKQNRADKIYDSSKDYQLLKAQEVLSCQLGK